MIQAQNHLYESLKDSTGAKAELDKAIQLFNSWVTTHHQVQGFEKEKLEADKLLRAAQAAWEIFEESQDTRQDLLKLLSAAKDAFIPKFVIAGFSFGGDLAFTARGAGALLTASLSAAWECGQAGRVLAREESGVSNRNGSAGTRF